ncbi:fumarylacetoacetate hydrolase family protein [Nocardia sp. NPDC020380]|uniref:fumarylacetoacetate hydrolase family protein n=1 Tax=Nocardia sp. NPDC020380 TaxID=3364309 RepID=UPI0037AF41EB
MRFGNINGRLSLIDGDKALDVEKASDGRFASDPGVVFAHWDEFREWGQQQPLGEAIPFTPESVGPPVVRPAQVFGIGLNYQAHASESGIQEAVPTPAVFTKFVSSITGPYSRVSLPSDKVDWEVELVVVVGRHAKDVRPEDGWSHVAGLTVGQDLSERAIQLSGPVPQFSLGKSYPGFAPIGPAVVTVDEFGDPDDLALSCDLDGEILQDGRTRDLTRSVPELIAYLSSIVQLLPGDLIFTGTPAGVGMARQPQRFLTPGATLNSHIEGIGTMSNTLDTMN